MALLCCSTATASSFKVLMSLSGVQPAFSAVAFTAAFRSFDLRLAAILGSSLFLLGAAAGHVYQMVTERNFAPGNAGIIFYMDIIVPLVGFVLLGLQRRYGRPLPRLI